MGLHLFLTAVKLNGKIADFRLASRHGYYAARRSRPDHAV